MSVSYANTTAWCHKCGQPMSASEVFFWDNICSTCRLHDFDREHDTNLVTPTREEYYLGLL